MKNGFNEEKKDSRSMLLSQDLIPNSRANAKNSCGDFQSMCRPSVPQICTRERIVLVTSFAKLVYFFFRRGTEDGGCVHQRLKN